MTSNASPKDGTAPNRPVIPLVSLGVLHQASVAGWVADEGDPSAASRGRAQTSKCHPGRGSCRHGREPGARLQDRKGELERSEVDTLAAYVKALGGKLKIIADFGDETYVLG
jgi:hypothetical protein